MCRAARSPLTPESSSDRLSAGDGWSLICDHQANEATGLIGHNGNSGLVNRKSGGGGGGGIKQIKDAGKKINRMRV